MKKHFLSLTLTFTFLVTPSPPAAASSVFHSITGQPEAPKDHSDKGPNAIWHGQYPDIGVNELPTVAPRRVQAPKDLLEPTQRIGLITIQYQNGTKTRCSGNLISTSFVLTSAHCLAQNHTNLIVAMSFYWQEVNQQQRSLRFPVLDVYYHRLMDNFLLKALEQTDLTDLGITRFQSQYDIAILKVKPPRSALPLSIQAPLTFLDDPVEILDAHLDQQNSAIAKIQGHVASYPGSKPYASLWQVSCTLLEGYNSLQSNCQTAPGSSGAGFYTQHEGQWYLYALVSSGEKEDTADNAEYWTSFSSDDVDAFRHIMANAPEKQKEYLRWPASRLLKQPYHILVHNQCDRPVYIHVTLKTLQNIYETYSSPLVSPDGFFVRENHFEMNTFEPEFYIHAITQQGDFEWKGNWTIPARFGTEQREVGAQKVVIERADLNQDYVHVLRCN